MTVPEHVATVEHLPRAGIWHVTCSYCGHVGQAQSFEADAQAIADRHNEIQGLER